MIMKIILFNYSHMFASFLYYLWRVKILLLLELTLVMRKLSALRQPLSFLIIYDCYKSRLGIVLKFVFLFLDHFIVVIPSKQVVYSSIWQHFRHLKAANKFLSSFLMIKQPQFLQWLQIWWSFEFLHWFVHSFPDWFSFFDIPLQLWFPYLSIHSKSGLTYIN